MSKSLRVLFVLAAVAVGCAPSPKEVADQAAADTKSLLSEALETARLTNGWASVDDVFVSNGWSSSAAARPHVPEASQSSEALDLVSKFADKLFAESNIVERPAGALVFALNGAIVCTDPRHNAATPSASCVADVDALQLRVKVTSGLDFTLQVGPSRLEPLVLQLRAKKSISLITDLGPMKDVVAFVNETLNENSPSPDSTFSGSGRVEVKLEKNGDFDFTLSQSTLSVLEGKWVQRGLERTASIAAKSPMLALRIEGPAHRATLTLDVGRTDAHFFVSDLSRPADGGVGTPVVFTLAGVSGEGVVSDEHAWQLTNLGLGDGQSTITTAAGTIASIDVNAALGRRFAVSGKGVAGGTQFELTPSLEAVVFSGFAGVPEWASVDSSFANSTFTGSLKAASGAPTFDVLKRTAVSTYRECQSDAYCGSGYLCHPVTKTCVVTCESASDCPSSAKSCASTTGATRSFCQCSTDSLCGSSSVCQPTSKLCAPSCVSDDECGTSGQTCERASGRCQAAPVGYDAGVPWYGGVRLVNGEVSISVSSPKGTESKHFNAGMCIVSGSGESGQNTLISSVRAATCP